MHALLMIAVLLAADPELATGLRQVAEGDYEAAVVTLDGVVRRLSGEPGRTRELIEADLQLGVALCALDQRDAAQGRFRDALALDPALRLAPDRFSPKVIALFEAARRERESARPRSRSKLPWLLGAGAAGAGGVVLATGLGEDAAPADAPAFTAARFATPVITCPDGIRNEPIEFALQVAARAGSSPLTIESATSTAVIVTSALPAEIGFANSRPTTASPARLFAGQSATLLLQSTILCDNDEGDPPRFNEWSGRATLTTSAGVFTVEAADRMRVNIP